MPQKLDEVTHVHKGRRDRSVSFAPKV
jgi:hypothetical protein